MTVYLSGPMTGISLQNRPLFNKWTKFLRDKGHQVINPCDNDGGSTDKGWEFYMELDLSSVMVSNAVVVLPGWETSKGARIEVLIAQTINRPVYTIEEFIRLVPKPLEFKVIASVVR